MKSPERKLYLGGRLRRLRRELGLNQSAMAGELGISPSYLNHLERNQRPVTAQVLLRMAEIYDVDLKSFAAEGKEGTGPDQLAEIFADPMFGDIGIPRYELLEVSDNSPSVADAISRLYAALVERRQHPEGGAPDESSFVTPESWVRDHIQAQRNYFTYLEEAAETLAGALGEPLTIAEPLRRRLKEGFGIDTRIVPPELLDGTSQHYDYHRKRLMLSALLRPESRTFAIAYQLALFEFGPLLKRMLEGATPPDVPTRRLLHMSLANYAAGAIMMPYEPFLRAAERHRYDLDRLCADFGASVEQVAHRLTTLGRSGLRGIPFFMLRVDAAGNISKRFAGESFPFSRFGGTCPRWNLHAAFRTPGRVVTQWVETPDGQQFFTISRTVERSVRLDPRENSQLAIGLGCDAKYARKLIYADGLDLNDPSVTPIGPACTICPRMRCPQRAAAPAGRTLTVNEMQKTISPYPFLAG
ncbi:helix-turn-helix domain-containing protein [Sphingosinicella rhizophila]|uniref:Short-chain fatty acyl-CoA regulator family protein n=1 Tax=Sphingosinicella rhizophila TaxID=3050082 RepID=A0ABU3Q7Z0_9SPHN|nr:short-chain fatty acyl-CoA regulator family protein [Sphingosinicella sp. GR2756]MDT9599525.1 short-chain fatty acyl-CoA regulator family protein [Sphingosinicella sp. GR2756]